MVQALSIKGSVPFLNISRRLIQRVASPFFYDFTLDAAARYDHTPQSWPRPYATAQPQAHAVASRQREDIEELRRLARPAKPRPTR
jgi:hypothetical protein